jgi:hypothetical protein
MMARLIWAALMTALATVPAAAQGTHIIGGTYAACRFAYQVQEAQAALAAGDRAWFDRIEGCFNPPIGTRVGVISRSGAYWRVRLFYDKRQSELAWVEARGVRSLDGNDPHLKR